jgi:hypothetical protein
MCADAPTSFAFESSIAIASAKQGESPEKLAESEHGFSAGLLIDRAIVAFPSIDRSET